MLFSKAALGLKKSVGSYLKFTGKSTAVGTAAGALSFLLHDTKEDSVIESTKTLAKSMFLGASPVIIPMKIAYKKITHDEDVALFFPDHFYKKCVKP